MKIRHLLVVAAAAAAVADVSAFEWEPVSMFPSPSSEVNTAYFVENISFQCYDAEGLKTTDVMPLWIDEDGNEIKAAWGQQDDWNPNQFGYHFNLSDFKSNGEYILLFPEGMLVDAAGEKSNVKETYYTFEVPELAAAMFEDFEVLSVFPDFSEPQGLWDDQLVKINTNHNDAIAFTQLFVTDNTTGESVTISSNFPVGRTLGDNSEISWNVANSFKFYQGHEYTAEFVFYNGIDEYSPDGVPTPVVARHSYSFTGKVEGYKYSEITLLSLTPEVGSSINQASQAVFTYTFSGPVNAYKAETPMGQFGTTEYPASCLSSNEDKTVWTLDLSDNDYIKTVDTELVIYLYARDMDGYQLQGSFGEEDSACYVGTWTCDLGAKPIVVVSPANGETVDSVTEIVVKSENGEPMTYNWGDMIITNESGESIGSLSYDGDGASATEFSFTNMIDESWNLVSLSNLTAGKYTINFPTGCFVFGEEFSSINSRSLTSEFQIAGTVSGAKEELEYKSVYPEMGSEVESLSQIVLTFAEAVDCDNFVVNVYSAARDAVVTGTGRMDYMDQNRVVVDLAEPIVVAGKYEVVIPNHVIINYDYFVSNGQSGLCNPEYRLHYTVDPQTGDDPVNPDDQETFNYTEVDPASGSTVSSLDVIKIWFPSLPNCWEFNAYLYKADAVGEEAGIVATATVMFDIFDDYLVNATFAEPFAVPGEYVFVIPAREIGDDEFGMSDGANGICNPEIRLYYTIDDGTGVGSISEISRGDVFDIQGRVVLRNASSADLKTLSKGIYVVGGKKIVVR